MPQEDREPGLTKEQERSASVSAVSVGDSATENREVDRFDVTALRQFFELLNDWDRDLFPALMDHLSDLACRWVFAHEFAHIASKLRFGSIPIAGRRFTRLPGPGNYYEETSSKATREDAADNIALSWGFERELQAFLAEDENQNPAKEGK